MYKILPVAEDTHLAAGHAKLVVLRGQADIVGAHCHRSLYTFLREAHLVARHPHHSRHLGIHFQAKRLELSVGLRRLVEDLSRRLRV